MFKTQNKQYKRLYKYLESDVVEEFYGEMVDRGSVSLSAGCYNTLEDDNGYLIIGSIYTKEKHFLKIWVGENEYEFYLDSYDEVSDKIREFIKDKK
jgi:hypothetical protein